MSTQTLFEAENDQSYDSGHNDHGHDEHANGSIKVLGLWVYLMSDCVLFGSLFASYAVLSGAFAGGPGPKDIFELPYVLVETFMLLLSSITYGYAMLALHRRDRGSVLKFLALTFCLGAIFVGMEIHEFHHLISHGYGPDRSGFLSGFFALVGTHGLHVASGLIWMAVVWHQVATKGLTAKNVTRLSCLSLFWHFLDLVWICVFTVVYMIGAF
ncbi:cytochrome o ubiquinol oxidase subunit III [Paraburkholderia hospita]|uniref:Cytochrome bo(3) ubiquinol oxidase subunit 3 n=1 Tax=Paraburkholderia hospita TaxID=169430 RepID=A0ABP2P8R7_9BURK|nr:cytochrome o ubiquinol oxidase subunit III [Paraburkholderia hospita]EIM94057.1 cytochrome o ubiquinol oxidase subunit III [Paraburkholderia hospita]OUL77888.1 cytochrome o ubiquinol oxidase subunit III [Paraburkholderia hospita]